MKKTITLLFLILSIQIQLISQTVISGGLVEGNWTAENSPYLIQGAILVNNGKTLTIDPGVEVKFEGNFILRVTGCLIAEGTESDSIIFTATNTSTGWHGIEFDNIESSNDSSVISFSKLEYAKHSLPGGALKIEYSSKIRISNSLIQHNTIIGTFYGGGIYCYYSDPLIKNNTIRNNSTETSGGGINLNQSYAIITGNTIMNNTCGAEGGGICVNWGAPTITGNKIYNNTSHCGGSGISLYSDNSLVYNNIITNNSQVESTCWSSGGGCSMNSSFCTFYSNTVVNNYGRESGGLFFTEYSNDLSNNILWGNQSSSGNIQIYLFNNESVPNIYYSDIEGGENGIGVNANVFFIGEFENNINQNPEFSNPSSGVGNNYNGNNANWSLNQNSPCINAGDPSGAYPDFDALGNPRVVDGIIDMGAIEFQGEVSPLELNLTAQPSEICVGESSIISTNTSGGSGTYTYSWTSDPEGFTSTNANPVVTPLETTEYTVVVSDGTTTLTESITLAVNQFPESAQNITGDNQVCRGDQNISFSIPVIDYSETYNWTLPEGFSITSGNNTNEITVTIGDNAESGQITVEGENDCGTGNSSTLDVSVHYVTANAGIDQTIDFGTSTTLEGNAENGSGNYSWSWEPVNFLVDAGIQNPQTTTLESNTEFNLTVIDETYGCTDEDQVNIFVETEELTVVATVDPETIEWGQIAQLDAIASGGLLNYDYFWTSYPNGFSSDIQNPEVSPQFTTVYYIEVNDGVSAVNDSIVLNVMVPPAIPSQPIGPGSIELAYTTNSHYSTPYIPGAITYSWSIDPEEAGTIETNGNSSTITWNPEFSGWCYLKVNAINEYGESEYSETLEIYIDYLIGANSIAIQQISIYPNPVNNILYFTGAKEFEEYKIYNSYGQIVDNGYIVDSKTNIINTEDFQSGLYFIQFINDEQKVTKKFIKN